MYAVGGGGGETADMVVDDMVLAPAEGVPSFWGRFLGLGMVHDEVGWAGGPGFGPEAAERQGPLVEQGG